MTAARTIFGVHGATIKQTYRLDIVGELLQLNGMLLVPRNSDVVAIVLIPQ